MVDLAMLQVVRDLVAIFGVIAGLTYYVLTVRNAQKIRELSLKAQELSLKAQEQALETRQAQLFMQLYDKWSSPEFNSNWSEIFYRWEWTDYDDFVRKYGAENQEAYSMWVSTGNYFEGIGVLVKRKLIDVNLVDDLISGYILRFWEKSRPIAVETRERRNWPQAWEWVEYLYNQIKPIVEEQHPELKA